MPERFCLTRCFAIRPVRVLALVFASALMTAIPASAAAAAATTFTGSATGTVLTVSANSFTIQTAGPRIGVVNALTAAANSITKRDYPYVYGGGHAEAGTASVGIRGPGYNGRRRGFDCSGSVAAVLSAAGLWPAGGGVPNDAGVITTLRSEGLIARGVGTGPVEVTLYDHPGVHIFMAIDGRFFGTSDGGGGGDPRGGAGWLDDGAPDAYSRAYKRYHFLPLVLRGSTSSGHILSFQLGGLQSTGSAFSQGSGLALGETVQVNYQETSSGALVATSLAFPGALTVSGTVAAIAADGSSLTIQTSSGASMTFSTVNDPAGLQNVNVGDDVQVTYVTSSAGTTTVGLTDSGASTPPSGAPPAGAPPSGTPTSASPPTGG